MRGRWATIIRWTGLGLVLAVGGTGAWAQAADVVWQAATAAYDAGNYQNALTSFQDFAEQFPDDERADVAAYRAAQSLGQLERYPEAANAFAQLAETYPNSRYADGARFNRGHYFFLAEQWQNAAAAYFDYTKLGTKPDLKAKAWFWRAEALYSLDRYPDAALAYQSFLDQPAEVLAAGDTRDLVAYGQLGLGLSQFGAEQWTPALAAFRAYLADNADGPAADQAAFFAAESQAHLDQTDAAVAAWAKLVDDQPASEYAPRALLRIAEVEGARGRVAQAEAATARLARDYPGQAQAAGAQRFELAYQQLQAKEWATAERLYREALVGADAEQQAIGLLGLAEAQFGAQQWAAAAATYRQLLADHPTHANAPTARARLAEALLHDEQFAASEAVGREYLQLSPDGADAAVVRYNLAYAILQQDRAQEAMTLFSEVVDANPAAASAAPLLLEMGRFGLESQRWADATRAYELYLQHHADAPGALNARWGLGQAAEGAGDQAAAIAAYEALAAAGGTDPLAADALGRLLELYRAAGDEPGAARTATALRQRFPAAAATARALLAEGYDHFSAKRYAQAIDTFELYLRDYPQDASRPSALANLAASYYLADAPANHYQKAAETYLALATQFPDSTSAEDAYYWAGQAQRQAGDEAGAIDSFQKFLAARPNHASAGAARTALTALLAGSERVEDAIAVLRAAVDAATTDAARASARYDLAWALYDAGQRDEAYTEFAAVAAEAAGTPLAADAEFRLADQLIERGRPVDAVRAYQAWLDKYPTHPLRPRVVYNQGLAHEQAEQYDEAVAAYQTVPAALDAAALEDEGGLRDAAAYRTAYAEWRAGRYPEALAGFDAYDRAWPQGTYLADSMFYRGQVYSRQGDWPQAETAFRALLQRYPQSNLANSGQFNLGVALQNQAKYQAAAEAYEPLTVARAGTDAALRALALLQRGQCLFMAARYEQATTVLEAALATNDAAVMPGARYYLGRTWQQRNDAERARGYYQQVVDEHPGSEYADRAAAALGELP